MSDKSFNNSFIFWNDPYEMSVYGLGMGKQGDLSGVLLQDLSQDNHNGDSKEVR